MSNPWLAVPFCVRLIINIARSRTRDAIFVDSDAYRDAALKGILKQFNALAGNHQMASATRMLDVAIPLYHSQINQSSNVDECKTAMRAFLETLMGNSVQLSKLQQQLLQTLHHCSMQDKPFKDF